MSIERVSEVLRRRGVRRVVHLHTDHFEPWRPYPGTGTNGEGAVAAVERFIERCEGNPIARRQTLFYKPHINYELDDSRELHRADPDDRLGFVPEPEADRQNAARMLKALVAAGHELQLHIHHENFNFNTRPPSDSIGHYLSEDGWRYDSARLELSVLLNLASMRRACGKPDATWFFVHGHWALNASDVRECTIVREIELLMRNGCAGDFTFPAGREHVDPRSAVPYLARPVALPMGYDRAEAEPIQAMGAGRPGRDRFFIWQTSQRHRQCSIDYFSGFVRKRLEDPPASALALAESGCVMNGVLYHKTHAHSVHPRYWEDDPDPVPPLLHPGVQAELGLLFDGVERIGGTVDFVTAGEVYREITGAAAVNASRPVSSPDPMLGRESIGFVDDHGHAVEAPPLPLQRSSLPAPAPRIPRAPDAPSPPRPVVLEAVAPPPPAPSAKGAPRREADFDEIASHVDAIACAEAMSRHSGMGPEQSGVTGFYVTRAKDGGLLSPPERMLAKHVLATPGVKQAYEIGSGLGVLTTFLAAAGKPAVGIERHIGRHDTARAILARVAESFPQASARGRLVKGKFPHVSEFDAGMDRSAALLTNLLGGADFEEQLHVIIGLKPFKYVFIDLTRFYERRPDIARQRELIRLFRVAGFSEPRELFDLGEDGKYVLFTNPSPLASSLPEVIWRRGKRGLSRLMRPWRKK